MSTNDPRNIGDPEVGPLHAATNAPVGDIQWLPEVTHRYDYRLTPYLQSLLRGRPAHDPLVRQFLPDDRELHALPHESADPIGDIPFSPVKGIVHRYPDRVLLKVAHACPVYCRFCFRREMVGRRGEPLQGAALDGAIDYVRSHPGVWEVILTGGDPLALSPRRLNDVLVRLATISHVRILRIHTRMPIVDPESIDDSLTGALKVTTPVYVALHINHPQEITEPVVAAIGRLLDTGAVLLSQTVLLRGVNDDAAVLEQLFRRLVALKVRPYYLHHPDLAPGTSHFRVSIEIGQALVHTLRQIMSGLCMPTYVLDIPGGFGKVPIGPGYLGARTLAHREVKDSRGMSHCYPE
ncbi:MAG TPA: lysine-2,3-aminomutase-like protein [Steroidobacteraceae bacterium]|nr:lysine-2,3-aminomutase-like protein [Steroidobacteraceae bacterium]